MHFMPSIPHIFGFLGLCIAGIVIHYSLMFLLAPISFWTVRAQGIVWGYYNLFNIAWLPDSAFHNFPSTETCEIHLATNFQTMLYDRLPSDLRGEVYEWLRENAKDERKASDSDEQFFYKTRKKALGPFKRRFWDLGESVKRDLAAAYDEKFTFLFTQLGIENTAEVVRKHVKPVVQHRQQPHEGMARVTAAPDDADLSD